MTDTVGDCEITVQDKCMFTPRTVITRKECSRPPPVFELNSSAPGRNRNFGTIQKPVMDRDHVGPLADAYRYSGDDDDDLATSPSDESC